MSCNLNDDSLEYRGCDLVGISVPELVNSVIFKLYIINHSCYFFPARYYPFSHTRKPVSEVTFFLKEPECSYSTINSSCHYVLFLECLELF